MTAIDRVRRAAIEAPGVTDAALRSAVYDAAAQPAPLGPYLDKVRDQAWTIADEDIGALQATGYSEDAILELTIAAAAGAAGRRYDAALRALRGDR
ncbi:MAG TPA: hypothetical protein VK736_04260 [Candidatus Binatia bacterium]|nr:hypothetical protein [Candidatus Binatia bacterium]